MNSDPKDYFTKINLPAPNSHKGQNGKLLIIGGSELFHAASKWSLDIASKFVDMVFYASILQNNQLIKEAKGEFWNGIVVPQTELENYLSESHAVLIGPGMIRGSETKHKVNSLLKKFPQKKWVIDAGALQMVDPKLLTNTCIITPHKKELKILLEKNISQAEILAKGVLILQKGPVDQIYFQNQVLEIEGGNAGMTKGGTGDVLAGLVAALYCNHDALTSAAIASFINKKAGEELYKTVGPFYNASDLVLAVPKVFWQYLQ